ncbi:hypothetical protein EBR57_04460 [bacterium]|jgi:hypothetical protein|nr:hypothetical protein [bacterium]
MDKMTPVSGAIHVIKHGWPVYPASRSAAEAILDSLFSMEFTLLGEIREIIDEEKQVRPATTVGDFFHLMEEMVKIGEVTQTQLDFIHGVVGKNPKENLSLAAFLYAALAKQAHGRQLVDKDLTLEIDAAISWIDEYVKYNTWREQVSAALAKE